MRGGYRIVDLRGVAITAGALTATNIPGTYEAAVNSYGKATLLSGLVIGSASYPERYVNFADSSGNMVADIDGAYTLTIADDDDVTITAVEQGGGE